MNRAGNGRLTLRELKRGNLIAAMQQADDEEDINKVLRWQCSSFFSQFIFYMLHYDFSPSFLGVGPDRIASLCLTGIFLMSTSMWYTAASGS
jgi:hypothetical protein